MLKKYVVAAALAASVMGGICLSSGTASAATPGFVPGGVYPSMGACDTAGNAGFPQGRWVGYYCESLGHGQYELWVQPN